MALSPEQMNKHGDIVVPYGFISLPYAIKNVYFLFTHTNEFNPAHCNADNKIPVAIDVEISL